MNWIVWRQQGRRGLGSIYIWASGNGGIKGDNCAYDSYASSIYTLSVSALTPQGKLLFNYFCLFWFITKIQLPHFCIHIGLSPYYAEPCPAVLTSLYVGGQHVRPHSVFDAEKTANVVSLLFYLIIFEFWIQNLLRNQKTIQVVPEGNNGCQNQFQGTSAAAPLAAGIIALLLEAKSVDGCFKNHEIFQLNSNLFFQSISYLEGCPTSCRSQFFTTETRPWTQDAIAN